MVPPRAVSLGPSSVVCGPAPPNQALECDPYLLIGEISVSQRA
jgi:hypothetical protein